MNRKILTTLFLIIINITVFAQINKNGIPFINNYSPTDYDASAQNWAICEDNRGVIYIGNTDDGILEFDGSSWRKIPISNGSIVRSLAHMDGTIYVGGVEEFGFLAPDKLGLMQYHSLTNQIDTIDFKDVWKVYVVDKKVYFCCDEVIYVFKDKRLIQTYRNVADSFLSFKVDDEIYWGNTTHGFFKLTEDSVVLPNGADFYGEKDIFLMLPWSETEVFIATIGQGIYIYNKETGLSKSLQSLGENYIELFNLLNDSQIYNGLRLRNGNFSIATLNNGCIIFSPEGEIIYRLDKENGLQDFVVINLYESNDGNLWLALNKGISYVELVTPITKLGNNYGLEGIILDVKRYHNILFVSTNIGVYYLEYNQNNIPEFKRLPLENRPVWDMEEYVIPESEKSFLLFATDYYVKEYKGLMEPDFISEIPYDCRVLYQSKFNPEKLYVGYVNGLALLEYKNGHWVDKEKQYDFTDLVRSIVEDSEGNMWLSTELNGVIQITKNQKVIRYGTEEGLPDLNETKVYSFNNKIICSTKSGIYYFNEKNQNFEKYDGFGEKYYLSNEEVRFINKVSENEVWIVSVDSKTEIEYIERLRISQDRIISITNVPFRRLVNNTFNNITFDNQNGVWIATTDVLYNYRERLNEDFTKYYNNLIRKVELLGIDSVVFKGAYYEDTLDLVVDLYQPDALKFTIPHKNNSFKFYYSTPFIPTDEMKYSYKLEGFDSDWSNWEVKTDKDYTNLDNGHYTFKVKAKNIYGIESEIVKYEFIIKPPWYKTLVAYFFYLILAVLIIIVIVKIYTRRLELEKIRLEQIVKERTEEVVKQKDEIEAQRDEIADKNRSITDSIEYASRIQTAVLPSNDFAEEILPEHFILFRPRDIVSGDFYWMTKKDNLLVVIAADCTGHGVPGAFMSMLGVSFLNEIVNRHDINSAGAILTQLRADVKKTLGQEGKEGEAKDGMDIALCIVDLEKMKMQYAGAYNPLYLYRDKELMEVKADRMPIGIYIKEKDSFTNNEIDLQKGDVFYIFSDGFQDQFGGEDGSKFKTKNFKKLLLEIHQKPMKEQREILDTTIDEWRGEWEQIDDIIVLGVRV